MEERFQFRHVHAITGTFVLVLLGVLLTVFVLAGRSQRWFIGNVPLQIVLPEAGAAGIRQGSEVYFLGTLVGSVLDVSVDPAGRMEAQVNIRRDFFRFVREDSSAVVKRKFGMVGDAYFEITRGDGQPLPEKNASIICNEQMASALESAVEEIRFQAVPALQKLGAGLDTWTALGSNLITTQERLDHLIARLDNLGEGIQEGRGVAGLLLADASVAEEMRTMLGRATQSMEKMQGTLQNLQQASANLQVASSHLPAFGEVLGNEAKDLPGLVLQTQTSMRELERLIQAMQRHWLVRRYVAPSDEAPAPPEQPHVQKRPPRILQSPRGATR